MKLVIAYIQPHRLSKVKEELYRAEIYKMSVTNSLGCGQQKGYHESYRGVDIEVNLLKKTRIEVAVNEDFVQPTVDAIIAGARTCGKNGDRAGDPDCGSGETATGTGRSADGTPENASGEIGAGKIGDGKIFVLPLYEVIRIRSGETGSEAIG